MCKISASAEFEFGGVIAPVGAHPSKSGVRLRAYDLGKIRAGCLVLVYVVITLVLPFTLIPADSAGIMYVL